MRFTRRFLLRGGSAVVALPFLDCFLDSKGRALAATGQAIPTRFGTFFWGCGLTKTLYLPKATGPNYDDTPQLASLKPYKNKLNLLSGFRAYVDDKPNIQHWTGNAAITTGIAPANDTQFDARTIDQTIAETIGHGARFRSIEVSCSGNKRESYSSLGGSNINPPETSPLSLYSKLFGAGFQDPSKGDWKPDPDVVLQKSVLSVVADDRKLLEMGVGAADRARLDQYFTSVRELEQTLDAELRRPQIAAHVAIPDAPDEMAMNKSVPNLRKVTPVLAKLLAIGLATDQTRVFNMAFSEPASTIYVPGDSRPFHQSTHEEPVDEAVGYQPITSKFSTYSMEGFAALLAALDGIPEGDGTLLDHSLVFAYTDTSNAKLHAVDGIPMLLAGSASGRMKTGIHYAGAGTTVARVGLTVQQALGLPVDRWGAESNLTNKPISEILA
ncbi:MAG: DUF1552 domain-containing protein [Alphaproteobacteria bacterium]|nr:DUF1552 domain-containing protein [Alphaproteobacteria bacterium]